MALPARTEKPTVEKPSTENPTTEFYLLIIVIKLAILCAFKLLKSICSMHTSYKKSLKKKYTAADIEARRPNSANDVNSANTR